MDFPSFGDADGYLLNGEGCLSGLENGDGISGCYRMVRPIGINLYYGLFYLIDDPVSRNYAMLSANLAGVFLIYWVLAKAFQIDFSKLPQSLFAGLIVLSTTIGQIPITMAELPAVTMFFLGMHWLWSPVKRPSIHHFTKFVGAGGFFALAALLKTNFFVYGFMAVGISLTLMLTRRKMSNRDLLKVVGFVALGSSLALIQPLLVYAHSGSIGLYAPGAIDGYKAAWGYPNVELIAYNYPIQSAFVSKMDNSHTLATYYFYKFYRAMWPGIVPLSYQGNEPTYLSLVALSWDDRVKIYLFAAGFGFTTVFGYLLARSQLAKALILTCAIWAPLQAALFHVEQRNFIVTRIVLMLSLLSILTSLYKGGTQEFASRLKKLVSWGGHKNSNFDVE